LFQYLRKAAPLAQIRSTSLPPKVLVQALHDGEVDSVLGYFPDLNSNDIYQQRLYSRDLVCMVRKGHPIRGRRMTLKQFINAEHVLVQDGGRSQEMFERDLANRKIERKVVLRTSHYMSIKTLIAQSDLIVVLPRTVSDLLADSEAVRFVAPPVEIRQYDLKQYWHRRFHHDPKGIWLRGVVAELFSEPHRESDRAQALV
jgi:DNA-binding transcriptional LysR family regulator